MAYDSKRGVIMLFGGHIWSSGIFQDDLWAWDGVAWRLVTNGGIPARSNHAMCYDEARDRLVVHGGTGLGVIYNDTWEWSGARWRLRASGLGSPSLRFAASMVYDKARARSVLFGGIGVGSPPNGTWEWDGTQWSQSNLTPTPSTSREHPPMAYDSARQRVMIVGGRDIQTGVVHDDTWEYYTPNPAIYAEFGTGCVGSVGIPILQPTPVSALPWLGDRFELELTPVPTNANVAWNIGFSKTQWGPLGLPAPLGIIGMPGCSLLASGDISLPGTVFGNRATVALQLPTSSAHVGLTFYNQAFVLDPAANALGVISSNAGEGVTGAR